MTVTLADSLPELEAQLAEAEQRAGALRKIVEGIRALNGHAAEVTTRIVDVARTLDDLAAEAPLRGRAAVREIVADRPGVWSLAELRQEMKRRGFFTSAKGLEVAVTRLCDAGEARRVDKGRYDFRPTEAGGSP